MATGLPQFTLLPAEDPQATPDQQVAAAVAGALATPLSLQTVTPPPPQPFGRSWRFDWETGQFVHAGQSPAPTSGLGAVQEWCLMALHVARYESPVFSDAFGIEDPDSPLGEFAVGEILSDWQRHIVEALLVHERITSVENFSLDWDPTVGVLTINNFDVVTDENQRFSVSDVTLQTGGA